MRMRFLTALAILLLTGCGSNAAVSTAIPTQQVPPSPSPAAAPALTPLPLPPHGLRAADVPAVVASVNGVPVPTWFYLSQVNLHLSLAASEAQAYPGITVTPAQARTIEQQALAAVINELLVVAYGEAHRWTPTSRQTSDAYDRLVQRRGGTAASLHQVAAEYLTVAQDQELTRYHLITQQVLDQFVAALQQPVDAASYRLIVSTSRDQAAQVRSLLAGSGRWVDLAARYSIDPLGRAAGGEQTVLHRADHADPALLSSVFHLPPQVVSEPIRLKQGWAIIQVLRLLPAPDRYSADQLRYQQWITSLRQRARITAYISLVPKKP